MASRLVTIGRQLKDPGTPLPADQAIEEQFLAGKVEADQAVNDQRATALGEVGTRLIEQYEDRLPDDGGEERVVEDPADVERFDTAFFTWNGGSNYTDSPNVTVERKVGDAWEPYADQSGEIPITVEYPSGPDSVPAYLQGGHEWHWTAHFEAFVAPFDVGSERATPAGTYRFAVEGERRESGEEVPYELTSGKFEVKPWDGIAISGLREESDGRVSVGVGSENSPFDSDGAVGPIDYPDSYGGPRKAEFVRWDRTLDRGEWFCFTCSFRPWLDAGDAERVQMTFFDPAGGFETVAATREGDRWVSERPLAEGESAFVGAGCVEDEHGNFNGSGSEAAVGASTALPAEAPGCFAEPPAEEPPVDPGPGAGGGGGEGDGGGDVALPAPGDGEAGPRPSPGPAPVACRRGGRRGEKLNGGPESDCLAGGRGDDRIAGRGGDDRLIGGPGDDVIAGGAGADEISCGPGKGDVVRADRLDSVSGCEKVRGRR
jgi:hypothetical protein